MTNAPPFATLADIGSMTGLEFMRAIIRGEFASAPMAKLLNFELKEVSEGRAVFRGTPLLDHYNPIGSVHGGWCGTLLDSCLGCAVQCAQPAGRGYTTLEYKVNLVRALTDRTGPVLAIGEVTHSGRRTAVAEGRIVGEADGKLYATGSTTCMVLDLA